MIAELTDVKITSSLVWLLVIQNAVGELTRFRDVNLLFNVRCQAMKGAMILEPLEQYDPVTGKADCVLYFKGPVRRKSLESNDLESLEGISVILLINFKNEDNNEHCSVVFRSNWGTEENPEYHHACKHYEVKPLGCQTYKTILTDIFIYFSEGLSPNGAFPSDKQGKPI